MRRRGRMRRLVAALVVAVAIESCVAALAHAGPAGAPGHACATAACEFRAVCRVDAVAQAPGAAAAASLAVLPPEAPPPAPGGPLACLIASGVGMAAPAAVATATPRSPPVLR